MPEFTVLRTGASCSSEPTTVWTLAKNVWSKSHFERRDGRTVV